MCGIVGAVSARNIVPILVEGLKRLEYRGYDSCGVAVHRGGGLERARSTARVAELQEQVARDLPPRTDVVQYCELAPTQRRLYRELRDLLPDAIYRSGMQLDGVEPDADGVTAIFAD